MRNRSYLFSFYKFRKILFKKRFLSVFYWWHKWWVSYTVSLPFMEIQSVIINTYISPFHRLLRDNDKHVNISVFQCQIKAKTIDAVHWSSQTVRKRQERRTGLVPCSPTVYSSLNKLLGKDSSHSDFLLHSRSSFFLPQ